MERLDIVIKSAVAFGGSLVTYLTGGWSESLSFLLFVIAVDVISGVSASVKEGKGLSSAVGSAGLAKKGLMLLVILLAHRMDVLLGTDIAMSGAVYFYIANELISIVENYGRIGLPLPEKMRDIIAVLKNKGGE
ncbi:phage holin family protein [Paenibacillus sediminis]|uniref:Toxin secretion/phage lysis holin n=1 Tax=Paenibacillus sediminis TaxID=664909 RepID=A0ABS4H6N6_9BACL|nr:phage holin family protein [Paenibacillus sediminis]MBP1938208.1 toxin secretion/phage lysis holin [Paenibacillus sediminis]